MTVTEKVLRLFRVDQQLRGLRSRSDQAQRFFQTQQDLLVQLTAKKATIEAQAKALRTAIASAEGEVAALDARMTKVRDQMNSAKTNKEYSAFLTELNTIKNEKGKHETAVLEQMTKADGIKAQLDEVVKQHDERRGIAASAQAECEKRESEIRDRVEQLRKEREVVAADVPAAAREKLEYLITTKGDDAMAPVQVLDKRNHEYTCDACQMALPVERLNLLLRGELTLCSNCGCILFADGEIVVTKGGKGRKAKDEAVS